MFALRLFDCNSGSANGLDAVETLERSRKFINLCKIESKDIGKKGKKDEIDLPPMCRKKEYPPHRHSQSIIKERMRLSVSAFTEFLNISFLFYLYLNISSAFRSPGTSCFIVFTDDNTQ